MSISLRRCAALAAAGSLAVFLGTPNPAVHLPFVMLAYPAALLLASRTERRSARAGRRAFRRGGGPLLDCRGRAQVRIFSLASGRALFHPARHVRGALGGVFSWIMARVRNVSPWRRAAIAGCVWYLLEWTRGWFGTGFSWLTLSSGLAAWPELVQPLSVLGEYGYSGFLAAAACLACEGLTRLFGGAASARRGSFLRAAPRSC